jgi:hypothetical protein
MPIVRLQEKVSASVSCGFHFAYFSVCTKHIWIFWLTIRSVILCSLSSFDCSQIFWNISWAIRSCWQPFYIWLSLQRTKWRISSYEIINAFDTVSFDNGRTTKLFFRVREYFFRKFCQLCKSYNSRFDYSKLFENFLQIAAVIWPQTRLIGNPTICIARGTLRTLKCL